MDFVVPALAIVAMAALMGGFVWLTRYIKRRGLASPEMARSMAGYEGVHPTAREARDAAGVQQEARVENPSADGGPPPSSR